jgi:predicted MFS family arabinose efflux permease
MFLLVLALLRGNTDGWGSARTIAELAGALAASIAFVAIERRVSAPMLPLQMFRRRDFTAAQIAAFAISSTFFAIYLYVTLYLQNVLHLSPLDAGLTYLPGTTIVFIVSGASAKLIARISPAVLLGTGLTLIAAGLSLLTIIGTHSSWLAAQPGMLVASLGTGIFNPTLATLALGAGPQESSGLLAGVNDTARQGGIAVGVAALGALVPAGAALGHGSAAAYVSGLHHALILAAAVAAAGAVVTVALIGTRRARRSVRRLVNAPEPAADLA